MSRRADPAVEAVIAGYRRSVALVRAQIAAYVESTWGALGSYRDADIAALVDGLVPMMQGARQHTAALTDAYLAAVAAQVLEMPAQPVGIPASVVSELSLRGVDDSTVYSRAGITVWTALANGSPIGDAARAGLSRLQAMTATDLQLAMTHSARYSMTASRHVVGYRRVTGGHCCDLCETAAGNLYHKGDLLPIHNRCSCSVEPVYGTADPGRIPAGTVTEDKGDRPIVRHHGEIGPVLAVNGQQFTGPNDL